MRRIIKAALLTLVAGVTATTISTASPALATDPTWITGPALSAITLSGSNITPIGSGFNLSTQATGFTFKYAGSPSQAGKFAQINIFDVVGGTTITLAANTVGTTSVACDPQVLSSDTHTCFFRLDGNAKAEIPVTLANVSAQSAFKYKILAGPNIQESGIAQVNFVSPTNTVKALRASVSAQRGGAGVVQFKVTDAGSATPNVRVNVSFTGVGGFLSGTSLTSDANGLVTAYLSDLGKQKGKSVIKVQVEGGTSSAQATITWK